MRIGFKGFLAWPAAGGRQNLFQKNREGGGETATTPSNLYKGGAAALIHSYSVWDISHPHT